MRFIDQTKLYAIAKRHGLSKDEPAKALQKIGEFSRKELRTFSNVLSNLSTEEIDECLTSEYFPGVVEGFVKTSPHDRLTTLAFLVLGIPVRGLRLPERARESFSFDVTADKSGNLYIGGKPVPYEGGISPHQRTLLEETEVPVSA